MSKLVNAQQRIVDLLVADAMFSADVPTPAGKAAVVMARKGDVQAKVREALTKVGAGAIVRQPVGDWTGTGPRLDFALSFVIAFTENTTTNNSGHTAEDMWENAVQLLHYKPVDPALRLAKNYFFMVDKKALTPAVPNPGSAFNAYFLKLTTTIVFP